MQITPLASSKSGRIFVREAVPSLQVGRRVVVTVLGRPKNGQVLVSLFGRRLSVETSMKLVKGEVLNLKVQAVHPRVVLKVEPEASRSQENTRILEAFVERLVGRLGDRPVRSFSVQNILEQALQAPKDASHAQAIGTLLDDLLGHPEALATLLIPVVDDDSGGRARVTIERGQSRGYLVRFDMHTDHLGHIESTARLDDGLDVEIFTETPESADLLRDHAIELFERLESLGIKRLEVLHRPRPTGLDVLV